MNQQQSYQVSENAAPLYLVPTPIGNLEDITFRALRIMKEADMIFAEDTRQTRKLCSHFEISTPLDSYHEHNKEQKEQKIISLLKDQKSVALVSDAGMPLVSDPGKEIVERCIEEHISVIALPGANAALTALTASGLGGGAFYFYGFLPRKKKEKEHLLSQLEPIQSPIIFYESPYRVKETVRHLSEKWGQRKFVLARELTKKFEEVLRGTGEEMLSYLQELAEPIKGECCLIVEGSNETTTDRTAWWEALDLLEHVEHYVNHGVSAKDAIKTVAKERGVPKREVYAAYHKL